MYIRLANIKDSADILRWRNDPTTRKMSINSAKISKNNHDSWYKKSLKSKNCMIFLGEDGKEKVGMCRFDYSLRSNSSTISINLNPLLRGKGLSSQLLKLCIEQYVDLKNVDLIAKVKIENVASLKIFKNAGFITESVSKNEVVLVLPFLPLKFEVVTTSHTDKLYTLLKNRKHSISHKKLPSLKEHKKFIKNKPYLHWYIICNKNPIGTFYIQKDNSIGINIDSKFSFPHYFSQVFKFISKNFKPAKSQASLVPSHFYLNTSPKNKEIIKIYEMFGMEEIQVSHKLPDMI